MGKLKNIKTLPLEMALTLASNSKIQKLLYIDTPSALEEELTNSIDLIAEGYIRTEVYSESGIQNYTKNTLLVISIDSIVLSTTSVSGEILIVTADETSLLENNKSRLLELADEIITSLDLQKFSGAGELRISSIRNITLSQFKTGYAIQFSCQDQPHRKAEL